MNIKRNKKGFTLIEVILAVALLGILCVATSAVMASCLKFLQNASSIARATNVAAGQLEDWKSGNDEKIIYSNGSPFTLNFQGKTPISQQGKYITVKDENADVPFKTFRPNDPENPSDPNNLLINVTNEIIVCRGNLTVNSNLTSSLLSTINAREIIVNSPSTISGTSGSEVNSDTNPLPSGFTNFSRSNNYKRIISPVPISTVSTTNSYYGVNTDYDVTSGDKFVYVKDFFMLQNGTIKVTNTNPSSNKTHKNLYIYINRYFYVNNVQLTVKIEGTGKDYTGVYFVYCGQDPVHIDNINCTYQGVYIYAPCADVTLVANNLSGILAEYVTIDGVTSFKPKISTEQPSWFDMIVKLTGN